MLEGGVAGLFVKVSGIAINHGLARTSADVSEGLECLGFVGCWVGLVVVTVVSTSGFWSHLVPLCCAVLPLICVSEFLGVRACVAGFGSAFWSGIVSCNVPQMVPMDTQPAQASTFSPLG
jgi:hypothetical protein